MRGLKLAASTPFQLPGIGAVARSAPPMRGLKHGDRLPFSVGRLSTSRAIRPAYEGIETFFLAELLKGSIHVARSAPPMRGLKH